MRLWSCLLAVLLLPTAVSDHARLTMAANGIDGELQLLQDARVTPALQKKLWEMGGVPEDFANAAVRIVKPDGAVADSTELERPLARLDPMPANLYDDSRQTWLVTTDYSTGTGSYAGPITTFVEVHDGRLHWLEATDSATGKTARIAVMHSLKTVWKTAPARDGHGREILEARCRPDARTKTGDVEFVLSYYRYAFDGTRWIRRVRETKGFSEFEDGFPARRLFP
jgi:hypothetical protein